MSIQIVVPVWNRKKITQLSLYSISKYKGRGNSVVVYNDHSTEYDNDFLVQYADEVFLLPEKLGVDRLRLHQLQAFLNTDHDLLYFTDNDVIHDPSFISVLLELHAKYTLPGGKSLPVCLYNSHVHNGPRNDIVEADGVVVRPYAPGVSILLSREMVEVVLKNYQAIAPRLNVIFNQTWDFVLFDLLRRPCVTSTTSYLEHFGASGLHCGEGEQGMNEDRAINPTPYLQAIWKPVINHILYEAESPLPLL